MAKSAIRLLPGVLLTIAIAVLAFALDRAQVHLTGRAWVESLVAAIILGTAVNTGFSPGERFRPGVRASSRIPLEIAIVLLGASTSLQAIGGAGFAVIVVVVAIVVVTLLASYALARLVGLPERMALLVSCGNAICGNSAIAAAAPVIGAKPQEIAAAIAFTAALGVVAVVLLPLIGVLAGLADARYGFLAGMLVYAVPQVFAATATAGPIAVQTATLIKLMRVLLLGPVLVALSLLRRGEAARLPLHRIVPWFVLGFAVMMILRSVGVIPDLALPWLRGTAGVLTIIAMAGLGLEVNLRDVLSSGGRVLAAGVLSLLVIGALSAAALMILPLP